MWSASKRAEAAHALGGAFLAGAWDEDGMVARGGAVYGRRPRWLRPLVRETLAAYHRPPLDRPRELAAYVALLLERRPPPGPPPPVRRWMVFTPEMGRTRWSVPSLPTPGDLATFLGLDTGELAWLADTRSLERHVEAERLRHYRYRWLPRSKGPPRVIERPKDRLKAIQRRLAREVLVLVPAHDAAHGFVPGRSVRTHAAAHLRTRVLVQADLEDFFACVGPGRVWATFRAIGYPEATAHVLTGLCTNVVPLAEWAAVPLPSEPRNGSAHFRLGRRLAFPHLPQGAPTSPALANLAAFGLDRRLAGLAVSVGGRYTRYADDLVFSGGEELLRRAASVRTLLTSVAREEGFRVNTAKGSLTTRAGRQVVTGIVVNERANVPRAEYDTLKALLHNARRDGPGDLDPAVVLGRISWVASLNPRRGAKLKERFAAVPWGGSPDSGPGSS
jgi:RNA-directed DNA polymerase